MIRKTLFFSSFEAGYAPLKDETEKEAALLPVSETGVSLKASVSTGPDCNWSGRGINRGWSGAHALLAEGRKEEGKSFAVLPLYGGLTVPVGKDTMLSYLLFPDCLTRDVDLAYNSHFFAVDLTFSDGSRLSSLRLPDQNGNPVTAAEQGNARCLFTREWNLVRVSLAAAAGKTVTAVSLVYEKPEGSGDIRVFLDDLRIADETPRPVFSPADDILITRGTMNNWEKSRGLMIPAVCVPNPFNFWAPSTYTDRFFYDYQASAIAQFGCSHQSSFHLLDRGVLHFMPNVTAVSAAESEIGAEARRSSFSHENEIARAHEYEVTFDEGTPASGVTFSMTPTDHAAVLRIVFPKSAPRKNLIFDAANTSGLVNVRGEIAFDGTVFTAKVDYKYPPASLGAVPMYFYGEFSTPPAEVFRAENAPHLTLVRFSDDTAEITVKIASSNLGYATAKHSLGLEVGDASYEEIRERARTLWDAILNLVETEGETENQRVTLRSSLYRMYMYPVNYSENIGTAEDPHLVYASPYRIGGDVPAIREGQLYTQNGFWDTYRTAWPAYALLTPDRDTKLLNGIVEHYRDAGWIGRWLNPGALDAMVGTSYDIVFADAAVKGIAFDREGAYEASLRSACCPSDGNFGRANNASAVFTGYTKDGVCWTMENALSDAAIAQMAELLGKKDEAAYLRNRGVNYTELFDKELDFFVQKDGSGRFVVDKEHFDPTKWDWGYVETNAWGTAFSAPQDPNGLAALYGGRVALARKLDAFFAAPADHTRANGTYQHEMFEAQDIRLGQYQHSNQPAHHILYTYNAIGEPWKTQRYTRDVLARLYSGGEIGQGVYGDEDNGEQSAWFFLTALGFYPYYPGSGEYAITSPLFRRMTLHLPTGDLTVRAENNSRENVYIRSMTVDGVPYDSCFISHERLLAAKEIVFVMDDKPSAFGVGSTPLSLTENGNHPVRKKDFLSGCRIESDADTALLTDDDARTGITASGTVTLTADSGSVRTAEMMTVTCGRDPGAAPAAVALEVRRDGNWVHAADRTLSFLFPEQTVPVLLSEPVRGTEFRVTLTCPMGEKMTVNELELIG